MKMQIDQMIDQIARKLVDSLCKKNEYISTAESCTGGMIASSIVGVPGVSDCFNEAFVTYSNASKIKNLGVSNATIFKYGVVSNNVVKEMAIGVCKKTGANMSIVTSGIAGPDGGTKEIPVGTVHMACMYDGKIIVERHLFKGDRADIRKQATLAALELCYNTMK